MRHALLSLTETVEAPDASGPYAPMCKGLLPLAEGRVIFAQIDLAAAMGAENVIFLVSTVPPELGEIEAYVLGAGMKFSLARDIADVSVRLAADDDILVVADNLLVSPELHGILAEEPGSWITCFAPGGISGESGIDGFERMDMNHLWAGLVLLKGRELFDVRELPRDWDAQSAALRVAIQRGYRHVMLPWSLAQNRSISHISTPAQARKASTRHARHLNASGPGLGHYLWRLPRIGKLAHKMWSWSWMRPLLQTLLLILPLLSLGLALYGWLVSAFASLLAARAAHVIYRQFYNNFHHLGSLKWLTPTHYTLSALAFGMAMLRLPPGGLAKIMLFIALITIGLNYLVRNDIDKSHSEPPLILSMLASHGPFLLAACILAWFPLVLELTIIWSLLMLGWLVYSQHLHHNEHEN